MLSATNNSTNRLCPTPDSTFAFGEEIGRGLKGGEVILLRGGLGAGKTLFTKGVLGGLGFDVDEVTSPSFTLVNLYKTDGFDVYHVDFWRLDEGGDVAHAVGLGEILEDPRAVVIMEWPERLGEFRFQRPVIEVGIEGDGGDPRSVSIVKNVQE